jgi:hypothetical protein
MTPATNIDCIEGEVQELARFRLRKRPSPETSSLRRRFLEIPFF